MYRFSFVGVMVVFIIILQLPCKLVVAQAMSPTQSRVYSYGRVKIEGETVFYYLESDDRGPDIQVFYEPLLFLVLKDEMSLESWYENEKLYLYVHPYQDHKIIENEIRADLKEKRKNKNETYNIGPLKIKFKFRSKKTEDKDPVFITDYWPSEYMTNSSKFAIESKYEMTKVQKDRFLRHIELDIESISLEYKFIGVVNRCYSAKSVIQSIQASELYKEVFGDGDELLVEHNQIVNLEKDIERTVKVQTKCTKVDFVDELSNGLAKQTKILSQFEELKSYNEDDFKADIETAFEKVENSEDQKQMVAEFRKKIKEAGSDSHSVSGSVDFMKLSAAFSVAGSKASFESKAEARKELSEILGRRGINVQSDGQKIVPKSMVVYTKGNLKDKLYQFINNKKIIEMNENNDEDGRIYKLSKRVFDSKIVKLEKRITELEKKLEEKFLANLVANERIIYVETWDNVENMMPFKLERFNSEYYTDNSRELIVDIKNYLNNNSDINWNIFANSANKYINTTSTKSKNRDAFLEILKRIGINAKYEDEKIVPKSIIPWLYVNYEVGDINLNASNEIELNTRKINLISDDVRMRAADDVRMRAADDVRMRAADDVRMRAADDIEMRAADDIEMRADDNIMIIGSKTNFVGSVNFKDTVKVRNENLAKVWACYYKFEVPRSDTFFHHYTIGYKNIDFVKIYDIEIHSEYHSKFRKYFPTFHVRRYHSNNNWNIVTRGLKSKDKFSVMVLFHDGYGIDYNDFGFDSFENLDSKKLIFKEKLGDRCL